MASIRHRIDLKAHPRVHTPSAFRLLWCLFFFLLIIPSSLLSKAQFNAGIGMYHCEPYSPDPIPDWFDREWVFKDYATISPGVTWPLNQRYKLGLRAYYHHRDYGFEYSKRDESIFSQYIDFPLSVIADFAGVEPYAGANLGIRINQIETTDIPSPLGYVNDMPKLIPAVHLGVRLPLEYSARLGLDISFHQDLVPYTRQLDRKVYQRRVVALLNGRFGKVPIKERHQKEIPQAVSDDNKPMDKTIIPDHIGLGFGFSAVSLQTPTFAPGDYIYKSKRTRYSMISNLGYNLSDKLMLTISPNLNTRSYTRMWNDHPNQKTSLVADYLDIPIMLHAQAIGTHWGLGLNTAFRVDPDREAKSFITGITTQAGFRLSERWGAYIRYTWDLQPYSQEWDIAKRQERFQAFLAVDLTNKPYPESSFEITSPDGRSKFFLNVGINSLRHEGMKRWITMYGCSIHQIGSNGWENGHNFSFGRWTAAKMDYSMSALRFLYQRTISWNYHRYGVYFAPGLGVDWGLRERDQEATKLIFNPLLCMEGGIRFKINSRANLEVGLRNINSAIYKSGVGLKASVNISVF